MNIAVIDLGSNSARMTVWRAEGNALSVLYNDRKYVRLSEGLADDDLLKPEPVERTLSALADFKAVCGRLNCDNVIAVATEAVRRAENGEAFIKKVLEQTGIRIRVLSGEDESLADFYASEEFVGSGALIMDVGGGSLELIKAGKAGMLGHVCLPYGAVVMTDRFGADRGALDHFFTEEFSHLDLVKDFHPESIIGLGGSVRALFDFSVGKDQGAFLSADEFFKVCESIFAMDYPSLSKCPAFRDRADIIKAGIAPFYALLKLTGAKGVTLNNRGVREGMLIRWLKTKS